MKAKKKRVIPGFGLSMGVTITILSLVVLIPLAALVIYTSRMHLSDIIETITRPRVLASFKVTFLTSQSRRPVLYSTPCNRSNAVIVNPSFLLRRMGASVFLSFFVVAILTDCFLFN